MKNSNMNSNVLLNDRPISQLPTLSKIFERIISKQLSNHLNNNSLFDKYQSRYRKLYSIGNISKLLTTYYTLLTTSYITLIITLLRK